jgi:hypothetical protein
VRDFFEDVGEEGEAFRFWDMRAVTTLLSAGQKGVWSREMGEGRGRARYRRFEEARLTRLATQCRRFLLR